MPKPKLKTIDIQNRALSKLTAEERKILGL